MFYRYKWGYWEALPTPLLRHRDKGAAGHGLSRCIARGSGGARSAGRRGVERRSGERRGAGAAGRGAAERGAAGRGAVERGAWSGGARSGGARSGGARSGGAGLVSYQSMGKRPLHRYCSVGTSLSNWR